MKHIQNKMCNTWIETPTEKKSIWNVWYWMPKRLKNMHNTHAKIRCNKIQMHRQTNACSINNGTMDATNRMMPPKRIICNGKHFSISLAANRKSIEMNASEKIIVCCSVDSIPTIYTNGVNKYTPCIRKKSIPNIYQHNEK